MSESGAARVSPGRRAIALLGVNLLVIGVLIALLECFGRWQGGERVGANIVPSWRFNHTWRPNSSWTHREWARLNPRWATPYVHHYNDEGWLEDYDVARAKPADTFRIFYLGDSFIEGAVAMEGSVPSLVEAHLNRRAAEAGGDLRVEVVNTGTASYSPLLYYLLLRYKILDYEPDLIVLVVDMTDDYDDWKYRQTAIYDVAGAPEAAPPRDILSSEFIDTERGSVRATPLARLRLLLYRHSHFYQYLTGRSSREPDGPDARASAPANRSGLYQRWSWCREEWDAATRRNVEQTFETIRLIARLLESRGVRLLLTGVPHYAQYAGDREGRTPPVLASRPHRELSRLAEELGVAYLNSYEALAPAIRGTPQARYYYRGDMHFNPRGYRIWARAHRNALALREQALLPGPLLE